MAATATEPDAKPRRLGWLRPPKLTSPDGTMALMDHLKEIRYRVTISVLAVVLAGIAAIFYYQQIVAFILRPFFSARDEILANNPEANLQLANDGVVAPFTLAVIACVLAGLLIACPIWMYQVWAFVAPGLMRNEKRYALGFLAVAVPLFLGGCALGYLVWPKGISVLLSFTPKDLDIMNLLDMGAFLAMEIKIILVFGASFVLPVILVALNMLGVVKGYQLGQARRFVVFGSFIFAAVATPSTDPFSMLALAIPVTVLFMVAEFVCRMLDKRKGITAETATEFAVDVDDGK